MDSLDYDRGMEEIEELRRNAARYEWLTRSTLDAEYKALRAQASSPEEFDALLDRAMGAPK